MLFILVPPLEHFGLTQRIDAAYKLAISGAVARRADLGIGAGGDRKPGARCRRSSALSPCSQPASCLFTLFVNGTTLRLVIGLLGLDRLSPRDAALRDQILALSYAEACEAAHDIAEAHALAPAAVRAASSHPTRPGSRRRTPTPPRREPDRARPSGDRPRRSRQPGAGARPRDADADPDCAARRPCKPCCTMRTPCSTALEPRAASAIKRAAAAILSFPVAFRIAYFLYRHFGIRRLLADRLADRVELLLVMRLLVDRLVDFNNERLRLIFGERITGSHWRDRRTPPGRVGWRVRRPTAAIPRLCRGARGHDFCANRRCARRPGDTTLV